MLTIDDVRAIPLFSTCPSYSMAIGTHTGNLAEAVCLSPLMH
jgi:hypothetical protein